PPGMPRLAEVTVRTFRGESVSGGVSHAHARPPSPGHKRAPEGRAWAWHTTRARPRVPCPRGLFGPRPCSATGGAAWACPPRKDWQAMTALASLGWNPSWAARFEPYAESGLFPGRVCAEHRELYHVDSERGTA